MYERLKVFMEAARTNRDLDAWDTDHKKTLKGFKEATERLKRYSDSQGFQGATADAMNQWVAESLQRISMVRSIYEAGHTTYEAGRSTMATALKEAEMISPTLLDSATEAMRDNPVVMVPSSSPGGGVSVLGKRFTTGAAYVDAVEAQANAQREAAAQRVLAMVNDRTSYIAALMKQQAQLREQVKQRTDHPGTVGGEAIQGIAQWSYSEDQGFGRAADRSPSSANYPGGFAQPWWSEADAAAAQNRTVASGAIPTQEPAYGELGSRTNPITDPQELMSTDLLHTPANGTAYRNGVVGGHTPAPPADAHHPLWRLNGGAASDSTTAGRLGGAGVRQGPVRAHSACVARPAWVRAASAVPVPSAAPASSAASAAPVPAPSAASADPVRVQTASAGPVRPVACPAPVAWALRACAASPARPTVWAPRALLD